MCVRSKKVSIDICYSARGRELAAARENVQFSRSFPLHLRFSARSHKGRNHGWRDLRSPLPAIVSSGLIKRFFLSGEFDRRSYIRRCSYRSDRERQITSDRVVIIHEWSPFHVKLTFRLVFSSPLNEGVRHNKRKRSWSYPARPSRSLLRCRLSRQKDWYRLWSSRNKIWHNNSHRPKKFY